MRNRTRSVQRSPSNRNWRYVVCDFAPSFAVNCDGHHTKVRELHAATGNEITSVVIGRIGRPENNGPRGGCRRGPAAPLLTRGLIRGSRHKSCPEKSGDSGLIPTLPATEMFPIQARNRRGGPAKAAALREPAAVGAQTSCISSCQGNSHARNQSIRRSSTNPVVNMSKM